MIDVNALDMDHDTAAHKAFRGHLLGCFKALCNYFKDEMDITIKNSQEESLEELMESNPEFREAYDEVQNVRKVCHDDETEGDEAAKVHS